jgi:type 1 fimbriae regulatory protein FimB
MNTKTAKRERQYISPGEVKTLLAAAKDGATRNPERDHALLTILTNHGLRVSEACNLLTSDVNLTGEPTIYVRHEKGGGASAHPLYKSDVAALRKWLAVRHAMTLDHDYLFVSEQRTQISRATINLMISTVSRKAELEHLRLHPHSFRSICITHRINQGEDIIAVQDWVGHKSILTTRKYFKFAPDRFKNFKSLV